MPSCLAVLQVGQSMVACPSRRHVLNLPTVASGSVWLSKSMTRLLPKSIDAVTSTLAAAVLTGAPCGGHAMAFMLGQRLLFRSRSAAMCHPIKLGADNMKCELSLHA